MGADRGVENRVIGSPGHRKSGEEATKICAKKHDLKSPRITDERDQISR
jgi:hypothetical protein